MGQDHGGLEPRNQGSEEKEFVLHVGTQKVDPLVGSTRASNVSKGEAPSGGRS